MIFKLGRHGLRSSVTAAFALGALLLSIALSVGTYVSARQLLVEQRERTALRQAYADAALVRDGLATSDKGVSEALGAVSPPAGASMYVRSGGQWYSSTLDQSGEGLTAVVREVVAGGSVGLGWTDRTDPHAVVVGIPLPTVDAEYFEVAVADELDATLHTLALALAIGAALTTVAGAALGRAASRRVLAPLRDVTGAAVAISAGDLERRLRDTDDPDLSELVASFNNMVDALRERIERDARFASDVSHELRTPLTTLTTSLALLQRGRNLDPQARSAVALMSDELARFRMALEDLLALGRLDAGINESALVPTEVGDLVRHALATAGTSPGSVGGERDAAIARVVVDRPQMVRALVNLLRNADLHGGGLSHVDVSATPHHVDIVVSDAGPGVAPHERRRIFERFARAGGTKVGTGSGLGLSIVAETVGRHGGQVWCEDAELGGAQFVVRLPRQPEREPTS
ncbi:Signal transduction histidine kinase [Nocardioides exalbidus]|uniref:histidine kinase n=1 Tax=Nocardioides exalbidus TaxID=402596 RepID=A0A1H4Y9F8_9ACTN|nr:HAMP domain-containing sensor histidine kinase [Nocardioides exalbidus]SED14467.1 Signal transduction histidine kinase [Nocardioides exalbidus]